MAQTVEQRGALGLRMKRSRLARNITLPSISTHTKIAVRFLEAIEAEDFEKLPGGIFTISYLRQYADAIQISPEELLELYRERCEAEAAKAAAAQPPSPPVRPSRAAWRWLWAWFYTA